MDLEHAVEKDALVYDMIRERDDYRGRCAAAVIRIEDDARTSRVVDDRGNVTALQIPIDLWREVRAMLQRDHIIPPTKGDA